MQPREKRLLTVGAVVLAVFLLRPLLDSLFLKPIRDRDSDIKSATEVVKSLENREFQLMSAMRGLADARAHSLPPSSEDAQREYSEWLTDLALLSNWRNPQVILGSRTPRPPATMIPVTVKAQATLDEVNEFLKRFQAAALLHRVTSLELTSPGFEGNPLLDVELTAEGAALQDAEPRTRLFPTAELRKAIDESDTTLAAGNAEEFPEAVPFLVRADRELLEVQAVHADQWTVARGALGTRAAEHSERTPIELLPMRADTEPTQSLPVVHRLFVRAPEAGELQLTADLRPAVPGREWTARLNLLNWDQSDGPPRFRIASGAPEGMTIDPAENSLVWTPAEDFPIGTIDLRIAALGGGGEEPVVESDIKVDVRRLNNPPELRIPDALDVWLGRPWRYELTASDEDGSDETLTYSLSGNLPDGLTIDSESGVLSWSPPAEMDLGEFDVEVTVGDSGQPAESDTRTLTLRLVDDNALYTYLTGTIRENGNWEAWLYDRSTNGLTVVRSGQEFRIADVAGKAIRIDESSVDIESEGQLYQLQLGQNLRSWTPVERQSDSTSGDTAVGSGDSSGA